MKKIFTLLGFATVISLSLISSVTLQSFVQKPQEREELQQTQQLPQGNRLTITVPDYMVDRDKWVYLFGYTNPQFYIIDSLYVKQGETTFAFNDLKIKSNTVQISVVPEGFALNWIHQFDDNFDLHFTTFENNTESISGTGGRSNYARIENNNYRRRLYLHTQDTLSKLRRKKVPFERIRQVEDSLDKVANDFFEKSLLEMLSSNFDEMLSVEITLLKNHFHYSKQQIDLIMTDLKKHFPDNKWIQAYPNQPKMAPLTAQTKAAIQKRRDLRHGEPSKIERPKVEPYRMGDMVTDLAIKDKDGKMVSLDSIKTKFVLVDFWAHWCAPCRKETPYLLQAQDEFPDQFTVLAVSVDKNAQKWLSTIGTDHSEELTHVLLGDGTEEAGLVLAKFDVKSLPANYLLDDQRKIIAIDLRGEQLLDVIRDFCK